LFGKEEASMSTPGPSEDNDLFSALSAISITGPDDTGLLWISFKPDNSNDAIGALSISAVSVAGRAMMSWRNM
jgi:hypothetical protein